MAGASNIARTRRLRMLAAAVATAALAAPATADANSCSFNASGKALSVSASTDSAVVVRSGNAIEVFRTDLNDTSRTPTVCSGGTPTVSTLDKITFQPSNYPQFTELMIDMSGGRFAPGATNETGTTDEIEFELGDGSYLRVYGTSGADGIAAGTSGVNLNAGSEGGFFPGDTDVTGADKVSLYGGDGDDALTSAGGDATGSSADVRFLIGGAGNDTITGGTYNDWVVGGPGDDSLDGGAGDIDRVEYSDTPGVTVSLALAGSAQNTGAAGTDTLEGFERLGGSPGDDVLTGSPASDSLIYGGAGDDWIDGGGGDDWLAGSTGTDTVSYASVASGGVEVSLNGISTQTSGGGGTDNLSEFENIVGSAVGDKLTGSDGPNVMTGGGGNDELSGLNGADVFYVRDGLADTVTCGLDNDTVNADPMGTDSIAADCEFVSFTDVTPPETTLTSGPEGTTADASPTFSFGSDDPTATFECSLDSAEFTACTSPTAVTELTDGAHTFAVRARDSADNVDPSPAQRDFVVDTAAPATPPVLSKLSVGRKIKFRLDRRARVRMTLARREGGSWEKLNGARRVRAKKGRNRVRFGGRWLGHELRPARYRLTARPRNHAGKGKRKREKFRIR